MGLQGSAWLLGLEERVFPNYKCVVLLAEMNSTFYWELGVSSC